MTQAERSGPRQEAALTHTNTDVPTVPQLVASVSVVEPISSAVAS